MQNHLTTSFHNFFNSKEIADLYEAENRLQIDLKWQLYEKKFELCRKKGIYPLHVALKYKDYQFAEALLARGYDKNLCKYIAKYEKDHPNKLSYLIDAKYDFKELPYLCAKYGNLELLKSCILTVDDWDKLSQRAIYGANPDILDFLHNSKKLIINEQMALIAINKLKVESLLWLRDQLDLKAIIKKHIDSVSGKSKYFLIKWGLMDGNESFSTYCEEWGSTSTIQEESKLEKLKKFKFRKETDGNTTDFEKI